MHNYNQDINKSEANIGWNKKKNRFDIGTISSNIYPVIHSRTGPSIMSMSSWESYSLRGFEVRNSKKK